MLHVNTKGRMDVRVIAGGVILMGAVLLGNWPEAVENMSPTMVRTVGAAVSDCNSRSVNTTSGRLGCTKVRGVRGNGSIKIVSVGKRN